jgi:uncharacterized protein (DUF697 family)
MTRKRLPKAITRTKADLREIAAGAVADVEAPPPAPRRAAKAGSAAADLPAIPPHAEPQAAVRLSLARKVVERHKVYAAMGGLFPLPIVNVAGVTAIILRMVKQLSDLYQVPFERERARSIIIGLMGGAVPAGLGSVATSTLIFAIPGSALVGLAVSSVTAAALTRGIGLVFVDHFENGGVPIDMLASERA